MAEIAYIEKDLPAAAQKVVADAQDICRDFARQGYDLTLRQLYYQFVANDLFPDDRTWRQTGTGRWVRDPNGTKNAEPNYKWLGGLINDARLAGMLDWRYIVDRTRSLRGGTGADTDPSQWIQAAADGYSVDKWENQPYHVEVWIEKDALVGVLDRACPPYEVNYFSCRGYTSQSAVWRAAQRLGQKIDEGKQVRIIHLGDHDPSGIDMTRDIQDRLCMFIAQDLNFAGTGEDPETYEDALGESFQVDRVALNMNQIKHYNPPPNPAKLSDSRGAGYVELHGSSSWELDALDPPVISDLVGGQIERYRDEHLWEETVSRENEEKAILVSLNTHWDEVADYVRAEWPDEIGGEDE